jgi:predicted DNA-binding WGR domain protein
MIVIRNQSTAIDSIFALDAQPEMRTMSVWSKKPKISKCSSLSGAKAVAVEPTLLGDSALVREWGRIGTLGRRRLDLHPDAAAAGEALEMWLERKTRRGYQVRASSGV